MAIYPQAAPGLLHKIEKALLTSSVSQESVWGCRVSIHFILGPSSLNLSAVLPTQTVSTSIKADLNGRDVDEDC